MTYYDSEVEKRTGRTLTGLALHKKVVKQWLRVALREIRLEVFGMAGEGCDDSPTLHFHFKLDSKHFDEHHQRRQQR